MCIMNGRKRQRRRTVSGDVVHVLIMYHVSQAVSFIVVGTRALGRSRHRLVLDTRRNEVHIGDDSDTVEGLGLNDIAIVPFWCSVQLASFLSSEATSLRSQFIRYVANGFIPRHTTKGP